MQDLGVSRLKIDVIYSAVAMFGQNAWDEDASLKTKGERRVLKRFPDNARTTWDDWRKNPNVFTD
jgi:hypothetical protein